MVTICCQAHRPTIDSSADTDANQALSMATATSECKQSSAVQTLIYTTSYIQCDTASEWAQGLY